MEDIIKKHVYDVLDKMGIEYQVKDHPPVFTIEEMKSYEIDNDCVVCKNLFLRDAKGKQHYLVMLDGDKQANLKQLAEKLGTSSLSFASEQRLNKYLGLKKGSVSPFGVLNDKDNHTIVVIDNDLKAIKRLGVHPNHNTSTVIMPSSVISDVIKTIGNRIVYVSI